MQDDRNKLLAAARAIVSRAQSEGRDCLTIAEQDQVDAHLNAVRRTTASIEADAKSRRILDGLDSMARGSHASHDASQRLAFTGDMAEAAAAKIMPAGYGEKAVAPSGAVTVPQSFAGDPVVLGRPPTDLLSVVPVVVQSSPQFAYLRQSTRVNNAAIVLEATAKPVSVYSVIKIEDQLDVVAHLSEAIPRYWMADSPALQAFISSELQFGLSRAVESMLISDISGASGIQTNAYGTSVLVTLRKSLTKLEANGYPPHAFVMHPNDFEAIELALLTTPAVEFGGLPLEPTTRKLWGISVALTVAATAGTALTLATGAVALNTDSGGINISWSETSNSDDWSKNLIRSRCESRYATSIYQPLGVVKSTLA